MSSSEAPEMSGFVEFLRRESQLLTLPAKISLPADYFVKWPQWGQRLNHSQLLRWEDLAQRWAIQWLEADEDGMFCRVGLAPGWRLRKMGCQPGQVRLLDAKGCLRAMVYTEDRSFEYSPPFVSLSLRYEIRRGYIQGDNECEWFYAIADTGTYPEEVLAYHGFGSFKTRTPEDFCLHPDALSWEEKEDAWARNWLNDNIPWWANALEWERGSRFDH